MDSDQLLRPQQSEHAPYHAGYIELVPDGDLFLTLTEQLDDLQGLCAGLGDEQSSRLHEPYTWSIKQVIGHCIDAERIFGYRMARAATGDKTPLSGFDENSFVTNMNYEDCKASELVAEFAHVRNGNIMLLRRAAGAAADHQATVDGNSVSVRAFAYLLAGHLEHHLRIVKKRLGKE